MDSFTAIVLIGFMILAVTGTSLLTLRNIKRYPLEGLYTIQRGSRFITAIAIAIVVVDILAWTIGRSQFGGTTDLIYTTIIVDAILGYLAGIRFLVIAQVRRRIRELHRLDERTASKISKTTLHL